MDFIDSLGNNTYSFDIGAFNWTLGAWRQLIKVAPVIQICRQYQINSMADFGCGKGDVKKILEANHQLPSIFWGIDIDKDANANIKADVCIDSTLQGESIDLVVCLDLVQNVPSEKRKGLFDEITSVLKKDGLLYLFFRTDKFPTDNDNSGYNIGGESIAMVIDSLKDYWLLSMWGVNAVKPCLEWPTFLPFEFNRIFYSLDDPFESKFVGMIFRKRKWIL